MDEKEVQGVEVLRKKPNKTEKETERYKNLLGKFFEETLYFGEGVED